ncbi:MAG: hypothetical protein OEW60_07975 [Thiovulaceae bacterium]|nr:hypothetical protein [Sulfurimonadaceae bacterium]
MGKCTIDAEYKGEERYSKLNIAYETEADKKLIDEALAEVTPKFDVQPHLYLTDASNGRKLLVVEYHDDYDRDAGKAFEEILKILNIKCS